MTKKPKIFRLRHLFNLSYIAGRLSDINSVSDVIRRVGKIPVYIGYQMLNGCYEIIGFLISAWRAIIVFFVLIWSKIESLYYIGRGWGIIAREKIFAFARGFLKASVYAAQLILKVFYKGRGVFIIVWSKAGVLYYALRGLGIITRERVFDFIGFLFNVARKTKEKIISGIYKLQFFGDIYRDLCLKRGLSNLKTTGDIKMKRTIPPMGTVFDSPLRVLWKFHPYCNYKCPYCFPELNICDGAKDYIKRSKEDCILSWNNFNRKYGPAQIDILGGEPFTSPDFPEILSAISMQNTVLVTTNLSWNPKLIIGRTDPAKVSFLFSYHPKCEPSLERFINKIVVLQNAGFPSIAAIVAWPPYLPKLPSWLREFYRNGIYVLVEPFVGEWMGREYPQSYTDFEREAIKNIDHENYMAPYARDLKSFGKRKDKTEIDFDTSFHFANVSPEGKLCNAGVSYFSVLYNGDVRRCGRGERLGEFFSGNFRLLDKPKPCLLDNCGCLGENLYIEGGTYGPKTTGDRV